MPAPAPLPRDILATWFAALERAGARIEGWPRWRFLAFSTVLSVVLSIVFFSPKFWLLQHPVPGSFEWERAFSFLHQCHSPFSTEVEPAMRWRLLPPLIAHLLHLPGYWPLIIPWIGLVALTMQWAAVAERLLRDRIAAAALTVGLGSSAAAITIATLHGINDAWFLVGLVAVCAGRGPGSLIWPGLLCPWVDERFLLAWPATLFCRWWLLGRTAQYTRALFVAAGALLPYVITRGGMTFLVVDRGSGRFLADALAAAPVYLPYAQIGWWMGYRLAWGLVGCTLLVWWSELRRREFVLGLALWLAGWGAITILAADLSRSTNILLPLVLCGAVALQRLAGALKTRLLLVTLACANLVVPYQWVTFNKIMPTWWLPLELLRLWESHS